MNKDQEGEGLEVEENLTFFRSELRVSDSDGDVPSSCVEEVELQIPKPVLTMAYILDLGEQLRLQVIEVCQVFFTICLEYPLINDVLISGRKFLG